MVIYWTSDVDFIYSLTLFTLILCARPFVLLIPSHPGLYVGCFDPIVSLFSVHVLLPAETESGAKACIMYISIILASPRNTDGL